MSSEKRGAWRGAIPGNGGQKLRGWATARERLVTFTSNCHYHAGCGVTCSIDTKQGASAAGKRWWGG